MKRMLLLLFLLAVGSVMLYAQAGSRIITPPSTLVSTPGVPHTHLFIYIPEGGANQAIPSGETPASIACIYGLVPPTNGCPKNGNVLPTGGAKAIAVVEYGVNNNVQNDLNVFNSQWGLPSVTVNTVCYPAPPCQDNSGSGWDLETALDIEYAHAMAPHAAIYIAAFTNDPLGDGAENGIASLIASTYGAGEVDNGWDFNGGDGWCAPPSNCELMYDQYFTQPGIVFFGSAGNGGALVSYPCVSPNVACAGGTHINRSAQGDFLGENCWYLSGGGQSAVEPQPSYQYPVKLSFRNFRSAPDMSADADYGTGVAVYNSTFGGCGGWCVIGGTSVASAVLTGYVNAAGSFHNSTSDELTEAYTWYGIGPFSYHKYFRDITMGSNGYPAGMGYDLCTGLGSPINPSGF